MFDFDIRSASGEKGDNLKMKKIWEKPKLIILVRGRPEESVLAGCKTTGTAGPNNQKLKCNLKSTGQCVVCSANTPS